MDDKTILKKLKDLERREKVHVACVVEYDAAGGGIGFLYTHDASWYLHGNDECETMEWAAGVGCNLSGIELGNSLDLISRATQLTVDQLSGRLVYECELGFTQRLLDMAASALRGEELAGEALSEIRYNTIVALSAPIEGLGSSFGRDASIAGYGRVRGQWKRLTSRLDEFIETVVDESV